MSDLGLIRDLAFIWVAALAASVLCARLRQPSIVGYIAAGILIGPHCLRLIGQPEQVETLAELGVALLLFALGVEAHLRGIFSSGKILAASICQIAATSIAAWLIAAASGIVKSPAEGFIFGFICALSSTAVVTKVLMDRFETDTVHGKLIIAMLIIQDLSLVPIISLLPVLQASGQADLSMSLSWAIGKALLLIFAVYIGASRIVPPLMKWVTKADSREMFLLTLISLCVCVAMISKELGLSLALGAFLAGVMISESPYGHQALSDLLPVRDLFSIVFFVSVGMLLDPTFIGSRWELVFSFVVLLLIGKAAIATFSARIAAGSWWSCMLVGAGLAQLGEFSFVIATLAHEINLVSDSVYNLFFASAVATIMASPAVITAVPRLLDRFAALRAQKLAAESDNPAKIDITNHVIVCGYGRTGRMVCEALGSLKIPFVVIEINGALIDELHEKRIPCVYGDVFGRTVLLHANLHGAAALVLTIPDPVAAITVTGFARFHKPDIKIIARAHRTEDIDIFRTAGANAVVQPEFESSFEITRLALSSLQAQQSTINQALAALARERYRLFKTIDLPGGELASGLDADFEGSWFVADGELSESIKSLDIRNRTGATIVAIKREGRLITHPSASERVIAGDQLYVAGNPEQLRAFQAASQAHPFCPTH